MTPYQHVQFEAYRLGSGNHRIVCPWCLGGTDKEKCLSLISTNSNNVSFRCFRASCGKGGGQYVPVQTKKEPRYFTAQTVSLDEDRKRWFEHRFGFVPEDTVYSSVMDRYIYTVRSPSLKIRGYIARSFSGAEPKVLTYNESPGDPFIGWAGRGSTTIIVEDWLSAEKICASVPFAGAVALNGTFLSLEMVREIHETTDGGQVILALDKDAWAKSIRYLQDFGSMFNPRLRVWRLEDDLKYVPSELIKKAILDDRPDFTGAAQHYRTTDYPSNHYGSRSL